LIVTLYTSCHFIKAIVVVLFISSICHLPQNGLERVS